MAPRVQQSSARRRYNHYYIESPGHRREVSENAFNAVAAFVNSGGAQHTITNIVSAGWIRDVASVRDSRHDGADPGDMKRAHRRGIHRFISAANVLASLGYRVSAQSAEVNELVDSISSAYCAPLPHGGYFSLQEGGQFGEALLIYTITSATGQRSFYDLSAEGGIVVYSESDGSSRRLRGDWDLPAVRRRVRYERVVASLENSPFCDNQLPKLDQK